MKKLNVAFRVLIAIVWTFPLLAGAEEPKGRTFTPLALSALVWEVSPSGIGEVQYEDWTYGLLAGLPPGAGYGNVAGVAVNLGWCGQFARGIWMSSLQSFWGVQIGFVNNGGLVRGLQGGAVNIPHDIQGVGVGAFNVVERDAQGVMVGLANAVSDNAKGVMVGLVNASEIGVLEDFVGRRISCVHIGLVNCADDWRGRDGQQGIVQIGLLNFVNGRLSWPFLNIRYSD